MNVCCLKEYVLLEGLLRDVEEDAVEEDIVEENTVEDTDEVKMIGYKKLARHYLADEPRKQNKNVRLSAAAYHRDNRMLIVGFNNGSFYLYEMPDVNMIHSLRYSVIFILYIV